MIGLLVAMPMAAGGQYTLLAEEKQERMSEEVTDHPWRWSARALALYLLSASLIASLPIIGDMFSGCFWNSVSALGSCFSLASASLPQTLELFGRDVPAPLRRMSVDGWFSSGLLTAASMLAGEGGSGLTLAMFSGGAECAQHFYALNFLLLVDSALFVWAWYLGEGGGVMSLVQRAG